MDKKEIVEQFLQEMTLLFNEIYEKENGKSEEQRKIIAFTSILVGIIKAATEEAAEIGAPIDDELRKSMIAALIELAKVKCFDLKKVSIFIWPDDISGTTQ